MPDDRLDISADADQLLHVLSSAITAWDRYNKAVNGATQASQNLAKSGNVTRVIEKMTAEGNKLIVTQEKIKGRWNDIRATLKAVSQDAAGLNDAFKPDRTFGLARTNAISASTAVDPVSQKATVEEVLKLSSAQERLVTIINKQKVGAKDLARIWKEVASGQVVQYSGVLKDVQSAVLGVVNAQKNLGSQAARSAAQLEKEAQQAARTAAIQAQAAKAMQAQTRAQAKARADNARVARSVGQATDYITRVRRVDPITAGGTESEALRIAKAQAKVVDVIKQQKIGVTEVSRIWKELANGEIVQYDSRLTKLQTAIAGLQNSHRALGSQAAKTAAQLEKERAASKAANIAQENAIKRINASDKARIKNLERIEALNRSRAGAQNTITSRFSQAKGSEDFANSSERERAVFLARTNELRKFVKANKVGAGEINRVWRDVDAGKLKTYGGTLDGVASRVRKFKDAQRGLGAEMRRTAASTNEAGKAGQGFFLTWKGIARLAAVQALHRTISLVTQSIRESIQEAIQLGNAIAEVQTISQNAQQSTEQWAKQSQLLSASFGTDTASQLEAAYQTLSNQIAEGAQITEFLVSANKLAATTTASTSEAVNALSSVINAYGLEAADADAISAKLFKAVELGRFRLGQIANTLGDVTVIANQLGVSIDEVSAALALFTKRGISPSKAMTQLRGLFLKILKPTEATKDLIAKTGYESAQAAIEVEGLAGFMKILEVATKGNASELAKYISRIRGLSGGILLQGESLKEYESILKEVTAATASYEKAQNLVLNSAAKKTQQTVQVMKNEFRDLGRSIVSGFARSMDLLFDLSSRLERERGLLEYVTDVRKEVNKQAEEYIQKAKDQEKAARKLAAAQIRESNAVYKITKDNYDNAFKAAIAQNDTLAKKISENVTKLAKVVTDSTSDIKKAQESIQEVIKGEKDLLFEWALEAKDTAGKIAAIQERLAALDAERGARIKAEGIDGAKAVYKERLDLIKQLRKLQLDAEKENLKSGKTRTDLERKRVEIIAKAEERIRKERERTLTRAQREEDRRAEKRGRKAKRLSKDSLLPKADQPYNLEELQQLAEIERKRKELVDVSFKQVDVTKLLRAETEAYSKTATKLQENLVKQRKEAEKQRLEQLLQVENLTLLNKSFKEFDIEEAIKAGGDDGLKLIEKQLTTIDGIVKAYAKLGIQRDGAFSDDALTKLKAELLVAAQLTDNQGRIRKTESERLELINKNIDALKRNKSALEDIKALNAQIYSTREKLTNEDSALFKTLETSLTGGLGQATAAEKEDLKLIYEILRKGNLKELNALLTTGELSPDVTNLGQYIDDGREAVLAFQDLLLRQSRLEASVTRVNKEFGASKQSIEANEAASKKWAAEAAKIAETYDLVDKQNKEVTNRLENIVKLVTKPLTIDTKTVEAIKKATDENATATKSIAVEGAKATEAAIKRAEQSKLTTAEFVKQLKAMKTISEIIEDGATPSELLKMKPKARGDVMLGRDTQSALLRPDEAVINASATRRFYSQLAAMNATPQSMATPGTSIGSLSINMQATGRLGYDALALGKQLKKLSARKLI
jgi:TP901 family phage tail tape measure protein